MYNLCKLAGILIELHGDMLALPLPSLGWVNLKLSDSTQARKTEGMTDVYSITVKCRTAINYWPRY